MAGLTPVGVVLRGLQIHVGDMPPLTCILDGYVVYSFEAERDSAAVSDGNGVRNTPQPDEQQSEPVLRAADGGDHAASDAQANAEPSEDVPEEATDAEREPDGDGDDKDDYDDCDGCDDEREGSGSGDAPQPSVPEQAAPSPVAATANDEHATSVSEADGVPAPGSPSGERQAYSAGRARTPAYAYPTRGRGQRSSTITYKLQSSIRTKLRSLGYAEDDIIILLVERFRKTALDRLTWLEAYKLQQMVDENKVPTLTDVVRN